MDQMLKTLMHLLRLISVYVRLVILAPVVQTLDSAIHWMMQLVSLILIRWLAIHSVDSAVQLLNNPGQLISYYEEDVTVSDMPTRVVRKLLMFPLNARVCAHITNCYVTWAFKHVSPK